MTNQSWQASQYTEHASFVSGFGSPVMDLLNPQAGESILDLGCGDGSLAEKMDSIGISVIGIDASESMVEATKSKGITAQVMSGDEIGFVNEFDAVFSNAALHWMLNYQAVVDGVYKSLKPSGRFVAEFGGFGNIACLCEAMQAVFYQHPEFGAFHNPWYFPSVEEYTQVLKSAGFKIDSIELIPRPTPLKTGVREWLKIFANYIIGELEQQQINTFLDEVEELVKPKLYTEKDGWVADYVRLRFSASK